MIDDLIIMSTDAIRRRLDETRQAPQVEIDLRYLLALVDMREERISELEAMHTSHAHPDDSNV